MARQEQKDNSQSKQAWVRTRLRHKLVGHQNVDNQRGPDRWNSPWLELEDSRGERKIGQSRWIIPVWTCTAIRSTVMVPEPRSRCKEKPRREMQQTMPCNLRCTFVIRAGLLLLSVEQAKNRRAQTVKLATPKERGKKGISREYMSKEKKKTRDYY